MSSTPRRLSDVARRGQRDRGARHGLRCVVLRRPNIKAKISQVLWSALRTVVRPPVPALHEKPTLRGLNIVSGTPGEYGAQPDRKQDCRSAAFSIASDTLSALRLAHRGSLGIASSVRYRDYDVGISRGHPRFGRLWFRTTQGVLVDMLPPCTLPAPHSHSSRFRPTPLACSS